MFPWGPALKLRGKFILAFLFCGLTPLLLSAFFGKMNATAALGNMVEEARVALETTAKEKLQALVDAKRAQLDDYFETVRNEALTVARVRLLPMSIVTMVPSFEAHRSERNVSEVELRKQREELRAWYAENFRPEFLAQNEGKEPDLDAYVDGLSEDTVSIQHRFFVQMDVPEPEEPPLPPAFDPSQHAPRRHGKLPPPMPAPVDFAQSFGQLDMLLGQVTERLGYYDLLLADGDSGVIIYSARRGVDFGANLKIGQLATSALGKCFRAVMESESPETVVFTDFSPYFPAYGQASSFLGVPVYLDEKRLGAAIFRLNLRQLNRIMSVQAGLGEKGAMLLTGPDRLLRSDLPADSSGRWNVRSSFLRPDNSRVVLQAGGRDLLDMVFGEQKAGTEVVQDFRERESVLAAYTPVDIMGATWALVAMVRTDEAFGSIGDMRRAADRYIARIVTFSNFFANGAIVILCSVAFLFARRIARPLRNTVDILKDMAAGEGDRTRRLTVIGRDEVAELALAFNEFMDKLEGIYVRLQREVAERKLAQTEIQKRETYFKTLIENAPDVIMILNTDFSANYVSPSYERTFGFTIKELQTRPPLDYIHPEDHEKVLNAMRSGIENPGVPYQVEIRFLHKGGDWRWVQAFGMNQVDDGIVNGIVVNMRDITDRKQAELIMREYNVTLEREVAERTMEIRRKTDDLGKALDELRSTQDQLVLNEKMASLGALTAGIAHEIKNPLNFVNNFADLSSELVDELREQIEKFKSAPDTADMEEIGELLQDIEGNVKKILEHGRRADNIVRSMLLHSRGVAGQRSKTDINKLLDEYVHLTYHGMRAQDNSFNIDFDLAYDDKAGMVEVVPQDISRVFLNILNNACYATNERAKAQRDGYKPLLTVRTRDLGDSVEIRVRDNGTGIPEDIRRDIFNPFFTTKPAGKGTGLGLSISYDIIVKEHHGEISCDSVPGEFTEFVIVLPKKMQADA